MTFSGRPFPRNSPKRIDRLAMAMRATGDRAPPHRQHLATSLTDSSLLFPDGEFGKSPQALKVRLRGARDWHPRRGRPLRRMSATQ